MIVVGFSMKTNGSPNSRKSRVRAAQMRCFSKASRPVVEAQKTM